MSDAAFDKIDDVLDTIVGPQLAAVQANTQISPCVCVLDGTLSRCILDRGDHGCGEPRAPAFQSAMGRCLLAGLSDAQAEAIFERSDRSRTTDRTVQSFLGLFNRLETVRRRGWAMVDRELDGELRSVAAPLFDARGRAVGAVGFTTDVNRVSLPKLRRELVPPLLDAVTEINHRLSGN